MPNKSTLLLLALGAFAVGTDNFVINGILPRIASAMSVSDATAGQLITVFALVYAVSAPVLAAATSARPRKTILVTAMVLFVLGNLLGAIAWAYWVIVVARVISALAAAMFVGPAIAVAAAVVPADFRGRAIAVVAGGLTVATAVGVPLGTLIGNLGSWRLTLVMVAVIAGIAVTGIGLVLPAVPEPPAVTLAQRLKVGASATVLVALAANVCTVAGTFSLFTYIAPFAIRETPITPTGTTVVLLIWGLAAVIGNPIGGRCTDRYGASRTFAVGVVVVMLALAALGLLTELTSPAQPASAVLLGVGIAVLGISSWALPPAQVHRVVGLAPEAPPLVSSLNSSATYLGLAAGGAIGGLVVGTASPAALGWAGAALQALALVFVAVSWRQQRAAHRTAATTAAPSR
jgi:predicted MFS family arabinose efflux permease